VEHLKLQATTTIDSRALEMDIKSALLINPTLAKHKKTNLGMNDSQWSIAHNGLLLHQGQTFIPETNDLWSWVLRANHDHRLAEHPGQSKTYQLVHRDYSWPKLWEFVEDYVRTCSICMHNKPKRHQPYGLLKQLPIPPCSWESISIDFIKQLPESQGFTDILVVVDRLTKQAIFILTMRTIDATGLAEVFVKNVFSKHSVPSHVTSDCGSEFMLRFFKALASALDIKLHFTSGYHPEANGQTERTNQTLKQYLRIYCNYQQLDWADLLPLAEFTYNN